MLNLKLHSSRSLTSDEVVRYHGVVFQETAYDRMREQVRCSDAACHQFPGFLREENAMLILCALSTFLSVALLSPAPNSITLALSENLPCLFCRLRS